MSRSPRFRLGTRIVPVLCAVALIAPAAVAQLAAPTPLQIGVDQFTQATCNASALTNHQANVEPDSFSNGSTIVAGYQVGRGGAIF